MRQQIDLGLVDIKFVKSEENMADLFTMSLKGEILESHEGRLVEMDKEEGC